MIDWIDIIIEKGGRAPPIVWRAAGTIRTLPADSQRRVNAAERRAWSPDQYAAAISRRTRVNEKGKGPTGPRAPSGVIVVQADGRYVNRPRANVFFLYFIFFSVFHGCVISTSHHE